MSFQWPVGKLDCINRALADTGNNLCATAEDGSDEWAVASPGYERALSTLIESHTWGFATKVATLTPSATAPADTEWDTAYPLPSDLVHIVWLRITDNTGDPTAAVTPRPVLYDILANQIVVNARGGPPQQSPPPTPSTITLKYVSNDQADPTFATPLFLEALTFYVISSIYRGFHGDPDNANKTYALAEQKAQQARTRYDQQKPKRQLWNSRVIASRRIRRPWPPVGNDGWGGTGIPG